MEKTKRKENFMYQYLATLSGSLIVINTGMHFGWPATALPKLLQKDSYVHVTISEASWIAAMPFLSAMLGAILEAFIVNRIGRKKALLLVSPTYLTAWIGIAYAPSVEVLYAARFIVGLGDGITFSAFAIYIGEISHSTIRGLLGSSVAIMLYFGYLLITIIGSYLSIPTTALLAGIFPVVHFLTFCLMPETPYFYLMKGRDDKAIVSLKKLRGTSEVEDEFQNIKRAIKEDSIKHGHWYDLFAVKSNRKGLIILLGLKSLQQLNGNAVITFYIQLIYDEFRIGILLTGPTIIYISLSLLIVSIISSMLVDKLGRRFLLLGSLLTLILALFVEGVYFYLQKETDYDMSKLGYLPLVFFIIYQSLFTIGVGTVLSVTSTELFATNVKALALCVSVIYYGFIVAVLSKLLQITQDAYGLYVPYFSFSLSSCVLGYIFIFFYVPETKGKTLEEIQVILKGKPAKTVHTINE